MILKSRFEVMGTELSEEYGRELFSELKEDATIKESYGTVFKEDLFREDNTMGNSTQLYTTVLAKAIYYKSYDRFQQYFDAVWQLTPADLGMPAGAGVYKIPKIEGTTAVKIADGQVVDYINDGKAEVLITTETYGIGTRITRRLLARGAKGFVDKLLTSASDGVMRAVAIDLVNGMAAGAATANTVSGGATYENIEEARKKVRMGKNSKGALFGFEPDQVVFSATGWYNLIVSTDAKNYIAYGQRNIPGERVENAYKVWMGLKVVEANLMETTKGGAAVEAIVIDHMNFMCYLQETALETFDGRLPGTAGDKEIIMAMDAGFVVLNAEAGAVITA